MKLRRGHRYLPFEQSGRGTIIAIMVTFGLITAVTLTLSIRGTDRSQNRATVVEVVGRQRTLAERYVSEVLLVRAGEHADPALTASLMQQSAHALLYGGTAPAVAGDDDDTKLTAITDARIRAQLTQESRLVHDLSAFGGALLAHRPLALVPATGREHILTHDPLQHLRILGALTSNVALNTSRTIADAADNNVKTLRTVQIALQIGGLLLSLLLAWGLVATTRRQTAHFRTLVTSSSDLIAVLGDNGCRYASRSLCRMLGLPESELLGNGLRQFVHEDDQAAFDVACETGEPADLTLNVRNAAGQWRHLEAKLTDLRSDRHLRGVVFSARDTTERIRLERELALQGQRDAFGSQLTEALEMVDDEPNAYELVERAITEISSTAPTELLLADSSRAHLGRVAASPTAGAPGCPVNSPFSCVAVRRGQPVTFESSEALNACPKLRGRESGACSAVCVPVSFMGRALGVLHSTGAEGEVASPEVVAQLTTLATQAGARIGTLRAFEKTQLQAATDGLTGLYNRRTMESNIRVLLGEDRPFAIAVADLDHFKAVNDTYGHEAGDRALRLFAQVADETLRDDDLLARWGGEEFVLVLPDIDRKRAVSILERLRERLAAAHSGDAPRFTASFGVTDSNAAPDVETLMQIADAALYTSKQAGRDRITVGEGDPVESPDATSGEKPSERRRPAMRPLLHEAADEPEPRPSGAEIR